MLHRKLVSLCINEGHSKIIDMSYHFNIYSVLFSAAAKGNIHVSLNGNPIGTCNITPQTTCIRHTTSASTQTDNYTTDENMNDRDSQCNIYNNIVSTRNNSQQSRTDCFGQKCEQSRSYETSNTFETEPNDHSSSLDKIRDILEAEIDPLGLLCRCFNVQKNIQDLDEKMAVMMTTTMTSLRNLSFTAGHVTTEGMYIIQGYIIDKRFYLSSRFYSLNQNRLDKA